jgi:hypothetical protein
MSGFQTPPGSTYPDRNSPSFAQSDASGGMVWQPYAMGGGEWAIPKVVALSDIDVERIARAVVRLMREAKL